METIEHIVRQPQERKHKTPILLQHGAWHGAWCWQNWLDYFAKLGYEVHAISLPGHGKSSQNKKHINSYTLGDYVEVLATEIEKMSTPPIVIGHSMGAGIVQKYLQYHALPAAVLLASIPAKGMLGTMIRRLRHHSRNTLKGLLTFNLYHWVETPELAQMMFLNAITEIDPVAFQQKLSTESLAIGLQTMFSFARINDSDTAVPTLVIAGEKDTVFTIAEGKATAKKYNADFLLIKDQAHNLMIESAWQSVADQIDRWISKQVGL